MQFELFVLRFMHMTAFALHSGKLKHYGFIASVIIPACMLLFSIDKDTHTIADLFKPGNIFALLLYTIPTFLICIFIYRHLSKHFGYTKNLLLTLLIGIPTGFTIIICIMYRLMH